MEYEVRLERAEPRVMAAISSSTPRSELGATIIRSLDAIWPEIRGQGVQFGHNVVVYRGGDGGSLTVDVGVEVLSEFTERGQVLLTVTPAGEVATTAHFG